MRTVFGAAPHVVPSPMQAVHPSFAVWADPSVRASPTGATKLADPSGSWLEPSFFSVTLKSSACPLDGFTAAS